MLHLSSNFRLFSLVASVHSLPHIITSLYYSLLWQVYTHFHILLHPCTILYCGKCTLISTYYYIPVLFSLVASVHSFSHIITSLYILSCGKCTLNSAYFLLHPWIILSGGKCTLISTYYYIHIVFYNRKYKEGVI